MIWVLNSAVVTSDKGVHIMPEHHNDNIDNIQDEVHCKQAIHTSVLMSEIVSKLRCKLSD